MRCSPARSTNSRRTPACAVKTEYSTCWGAWCLSTVAPPPAGAPPAPPEGEPSEASLMPGNIPRRTPPQTARRRHSRAQAFEILASLEAIPYAGEQRIKSAEQRNKSADQGDKSYLRELPTAGIFCTLSQRLGQSKVNIARG